MPMSRGAVAAALTTVVVFGMSRCGPDSGCSTLHPLRGWSYSNGMWRDTTDLVVGLSRHEDGPITPVGCAP